MNNLNKIRTLVIKAVNGGKREASELRKSVKLFFKGIKYSKISSYNQNLLKPLIASYEITQKKALNEIDKARLCLNFEYKSNNHIYYTYSGELSPIKFRRFVQVVHESSVLDNEKERFMAYAGWVLAFGSFWGDEGSSETDKHDFRIEFYLESMEKPSINLKILGKKTERYSYITEKIDEVMHGKE